VVGGGEIVLSSQYCCKWMYFFYHNNSDVDHGGTGGVDNEVVNRVYAMN